MSPEERFERIENAIEKHNTAVRDLIIVSRALVTTSENVLASQKEVGAHLDQVARDIAELRDAQAATDDKLNIFIDTVDRIIRRMGGEPS
jgi:hypothetical protein